MKIYKSNRLAIPLLIFSVLVIVSLACSITIPTPAPKVSTATPAPTGALAPTDIVSGATPAPTPVYVAPDITALPEPPERPGDFLWVGMNQAGSVINFCVNGNQVDMIHLVMEVYCRDKQTGENNSYWVNVNLGEEVPFLLDAQENFSGGYQIPDGVYKDLIIDVDGDLGGSHGNVFVLLHSENDVARCESDPDTSIDVQRGTSLCVR